MADLEGFQSFHFENIKKTSKLVVLLVVYLCACVCVCFIYVQYACNKWM